MKELFEKIGEFLERAKNEKRLLITTHTYADLDALASLYILYNLLHWGNVYIPSNISPLYKDFFVYNSERFPRSFLPEKTDDWALLVCDVSSRKRLDPKLRRANFSKTLSIDHHKSDKSDFEHLLLLDAGALTSPLSLFYTEYKERLTQWELNFFLAAIYDDTQRFSTPTTREIDFRAAARLVKMGANVEEGAKYSKGEFTKEGIHLLSQGIENLRTYIVGRRKVGITVVHWEKDPSFPLSPVASRVFELSPAPTVFFLLFSPKSVFIIARTKEPDVDVREVLEKITKTPVGGHSSASAVRLKRKDWKETTLSNIVNLLLVRFSETVPPPTLAFEIMNYPVHTVHVKEPMKKAEEEMRKFGYSGLVVVDNEGKVVGVISRKDIDKASKYRVERDPVAAYMSQPPVVATPDTSVDEIAELMYKYRVSRIPIVDDDMKPIGIITKTDLLYLSVRENELPTKHRVKYLLEKHVAGKLLRYVKVAAEVAAKMGVKVYLVGGLVRDVLLEREAKDIDILIEGSHSENPSATLERFLNEFSRKVNGVVKFQTSYLTAKVFIGDYYVDVAHSRAEHYHAPGKLPEVVFSSIKTDLKRRDFTVNAMAISLNSESYGELIDFFGGYKDLLKKKLRVLHNLSFVEDPTRIVRGLRFEAKLGFSFEKTTLDLLKKSVKEKHLLRISLERFFEEIKRGLKMKSLGWKFALRTVELGLWTNFFSALQVPPFLLKEDRVAKLEKLVPLDEGRRWKLYLSIIFRGAPREELGKWRSKLPFSKETIRILTYPWEECEEKEEKEGLGAVLRDMWHYRDFLFVHFPQWENELSAVLPFSSPFAPLPISPEEVKKTLENAGKPTSCMGKALAELLNLWLKNPKIEKRDLLETLKEVMG